MFVLEPPPDPPRGGDREFFKWICAFHAISHIFSSVGRKATQPLPRQGILFEGESMLVAKTRAVIYPHFYYDK